MSTQLAELKNLNKTIPKEFFKAMERWVFSDKDSEYKESCQQFKTRCINALKFIVN